MRSCVRLHNEQAYDIKCATGGNRFELRADGIVGEIISQFDGHGAFGRPQFSRGIYQDAGGDAFITAPLIEEATLDGP